MIIQEYLYYATSVLQRSAPSAADTAIVAMSLYAVWGNKAPLSKWLGSTLSLLVGATLAALTVHSSAAWTNLLYSFAVLLSLVLSTSTAGYIWFQAFHLLGVYRVLNGSSGVWSRVACALMHGVLVLTNLDSSSKSLLNQVWQQCTYAQERYLMKLHRLRQVTVDDLWPLSERYQLRTAYSDFKLNTSESYFVILAIFRMMWRPMIPVYIVGLLLQFIPLLRIKLNSNIMRNVDDLSNYSMLMIVADIARVVVVQLLDNQQSVARQFIQKEMARAENAIDIELFRLPLQRMGLVKDSDGFMSSSYYIRPFIELPQDVERLLSALFSVAMSGWMLYNHIGYYVVIAVVVPHMLNLVYLGLGFIIGDEYEWSEYRGSSNALSDIQDMTKGIKSIKVFAWEKMYPNFTPKPVFMTKDKLPWYAPIVRLIWALLETLDSLVNKLGALAAIYAFATVSPMANVTISNATILEIDALIRNLQSDVTSISYIISGFKRISKDNKQVETMLRGEFLGSLPYSDDTSKAGPSVEMNNCNFSWGKGDNPRNILSDVTLSASAGELVAIVGKTGAGKSSLLLAMCSETRMTQGTGKLVGKIAYLEQQPWIMNDTLRANILFGREYEEDYYWKVLDACALTDDLEMWPDSDMTVIGENGMNISGGQRARLALARTVYSKADIYFLDDPLSAVDAIVKRHILDNIILSTGLLGDKLRFVTTNADNILPLCNQIASVKDGHVSVKVQTPLAHTAFKSKGATASKVKDIHKASIEQITAPDVKQKEGNSSTGKDPKSNAEPLKQWSRWSNTKYAIRICGLTMILTIVITKLFEKISQALLDMYETDVLKVNGDSSTGNGNAMLAYVTATTLSNLFSSLMWKVQLYIKGYLTDKNFEQRIGNHLIRGLQFAPLSYFESKQHREISSDHSRASYTFTSSAYFYLSYSLADAASSLVLVYRIARSSPWLLACIPLFWLAHYVMECAFDPLYKGFNEVEKNVTDDRDRNKSLVENGAQMIRLFDVEPHFTNNYIKSAESKARLDLVKYAYSNLHGLVSSATKTVLHSLLLYVYIVMSKFGLYTIRAGDVAEFRQNCSSMGWKVSTISALPLKTRELLAKINEFRNLAEREPEAPYVVDSCRPSAQWPPNGKLEFRDFSMRYGADLGYALKNINLTINPGEKIGIVGRTGAGKSSLAKVLFRLVHENTSGSILIDGQDISEFGVGDYRPRLGMIPQESTMLDGSIRHNLDPLNQFDIEQMWASLIKCNMAKSLSSCSISTGDDDDIKFDSNSEEARKRKQWKKAGWFKRVLLFIMKKMPRSMDASEFKIYRGLDRYANSCYGGISSGQEQLFGLCRVIMRRRKIIVLDEATANVDLETDKMVQELIRKEFSDCTVLTIAHRLETIMKSDRIIVMDKGTIAEIGTPEELLAKDGMFAQLVKTSDFGQ